ncbi:MAG: hypothetical protein R6U32_05650 [Candidatus Woesearchaeota archaeon]
MTTTTSLTEKYINEHPSIKDCLKKGLLNYSSLARMIAEDLGITKKTSNEAILIAARRFAEKLKGKESGESKIRDLLSKSELEIKNKIAAIIIEKEIYPDNLIELEKSIKKDKGIFYAIEGSGAITIIASGKHIDEIKRPFRNNALRINKNLAMVVLKSSKELEDIPGVAAHLYSLFWDHGVNIVETMSCWTDVIFIIDEKDIAKVMEFLDF